VTLKHWAWMVLVLCTTGFMASLMVNVGALLGLHMALDAASWYLLVAIFPVMLATSIYFHWLVVRLGFPLVFSHAFLRSASLIRWMQVILFLYMLLWLAKIPRRGPEVAAPTPELLSSVAMLFYFYIGSTLYAVRPGTDAWRKW
jgi:hypothetical protein